MAKEIESKHTGGVGFDEEHRTFVVGSIVLSASFVEATINEVYQDASDNPQSYITALPPESLTALAVFWKESGEDQDRPAGGALLKYQVALVLCRKPPFDRGTQSFQNAQLLIRLRNYLIHYKPEWIGTSESHKLGEQLQQRDFQPNSLSVGSANPYFPDKCLGYGCANWHRPKVQAVILWKFRKSAGNPKSWHT